MYRPLLVALATFLVACEPVPDIRFVPDDAAASEDGSAPPDGGTDAAGCGVAPEPGGTCCGTVWCFGPCDATKCSECAAKSCPSGEVCCATPGTVNCKPKC